jgi:hypothetical protein
VKPWLVLIWPTRLCAGNVAQDALSFAAGVSPSQNPSCRRPTERYLTSYGAPSVPSFHKHYQHQHQINIESSSTSTSLHTPSSHTPDIILLLPPTTPSTQYKMDNRAIRLPPTTRRNIFASHTAQNPDQRQQPQHAPARRQNGAAPSIRPDSREIEADIFSSSADEDFVERDALGEYIVKAPTPVYRDMGVGSEEDDETGMSVPVAVLLTGILYFCLFF